jgi:hypothetical protein
VKATKELILAGTAPEPFLVPALDAEVMIRRLHEGEAEEVQAAQMTGMKAGGAIPTQRPADRLAKGGIQRPAVRQSIEDEANVSIDLAGVVIGSHRANQLAAHYGLVDPAMSLAEVQKTDADIVQQIGEEVIRRSGLSRAAAIREFRGLGEGADDAGAPDGGDTAGEDAG